MSALDVEHLDNGDVRLSRKYPARQAGCATVRLRLTAAEFLEFRTDMAAGKFDPPLRSSVTPAGGAASPPLDGAHEARTADTVAPARGVTTDLRKKTN